MTSKNSGKPRPRTAKDAARDALKAILSEKPKHGENGTNDSLAIPPRSSRPASTEKMGDKDHAEWTAG